MEEMVFSVSEFVGVLNQTLEYTYPSVSIVGELANFRVSKGKWVYFDLKDDNAQVKFFATIYQLPGPLEDGLMIQVRGVPRLHALYGFSVNVQFMQPVGEGSIRKASALLEAKLATEGLFDASRKRLLPYPPKRIGLIASLESAAYQDFIKILHERWGGIDIQLADVQVQGAPAVDQIVKAIEYFNSHAEPVEVLVITRGGGSAEDLAVFSTEPVTRAVAGSRIPTIVAIGHEVDISLAELAADQRASTPSNAAQLLVPDKRHVLEQLRDYKLVLANGLDRQLEGKAREITVLAATVQSAMEDTLEDTERSLRSVSKLLAALSPRAALQRGYAVLRHAGQVVRSGKGLKPGQALTIRLTDATVDASVTQVTLE